MRRGKNREKGRFVKRENKGVRRMGRGEGNGEKRNRSKEETQREDKGEGGVIISS